MGNCNGASAACSVTGEIEKPIDRPTDQVDYLIDLQFYSNSYAPPSTPSVHVCSIVVQFSEEISKLLEICYVLLICRLGLGCAAYEEW